MTSAQVVADLRRLAMDAADRHALVLLVARDPASAEVMDADVELRALVTAALAGDADAGLAMAALMAAMRDRAGRRR